MREDHLIRNLLLKELQAGRMSRRQFIQTSIMAGLGLAGVGAMGARPVMAQRIAR